VKEKDRERERIGVPDRVERKIGLKVRVDGGGGRFATLISNDAERLGRNIGDRANCDRQWRSLYTDPRKG